MVAMSLIRSRTLRVAVLAVVAFPGVSTGARAQGSSPGEAGVSEKLGAQVALDAVLKDEDGKDITLGQLIDKPTILTLNYFTCTGICSPLLNGLADCLNQIGIEPGRDFQVITMSFDPGDTPEVAHQKRINYLKQMRRPFPPGAWRFLTGSAADTKAVTDSVGFNFRKAESGGFVHPGVIVMLTPKGIVSRYMYGISFLPADVQMSVQEAAAGQVRPTVSRILAFCYSYDPQSRSYVLSMTRVMGTVTLLFAAGFGLFLLRGKSRSRKDKTRLSA